ncbi:MAG: hypothetical protein KDA73_09160 [Rhodobacteraceae bacterium]|nr:hypothetical protein [Paracoccaceae bacterium]
MQSVTPMHPAAPAHLPSFITAPGSADWLMQGTAVFLILTVLSVGLVYLRLHALPEHMAHRANKVQLQVVAVLTLLALFTHNHLFWVAALLLALVELPDFGRPVGSMARSLEKLAGRDVADPDELTDNGETDAEARRREAGVTPQTSGGGA